MTLRLLSRPAVVLRAGFMAANSPTAQVAGHNGAEPATDNSCGAAGKTKRGVRRARISEVGR